MKELLYNILKHSNKVQNREEFNKRMGDKTIFMRLVGYELYDPNTFIKVYSHKVSYANLFNKITKRIETIKINKTEEKNKITTPKYQAFIVSSQIL